jgi:hypothetical protein
MNIFSQLELSKQRIKHLLKIERNKTKYTQHLKNIVVI